jgi:hypothetical protein
MKPEASEYYVLMPLVSIYTVLFFGLHQKHLVSSIKTPISQEIEAKFSVCWSNTKFKEPTEPRVMAQNPKSNSLITRMKHHRFKYLPIYADYFINRNRCAIGHNDNPFIFVYFFS